jgi:hypothetical protein
MAEHADIAVEFMIIIFENNAGLPPDGSVAESYAAELGDPQIPVVADPAKQILNSTPWGDTSLPGKCILTPEMEILECYTGHGNETAFDAVLDHFGA